MVKPGDWRWWWLWFTMIFQRRTSNLPPKELPSHLCWQLNEVQRHVRLLFLPAPRNDSSARHGHVARRSHQSPAQERAGHISEEISLFEVSEWRALNVNRNKFIFDFRNYFSW